MTMTHASLFSGIGGFDLAAEWAGWTNPFNCEIDPFCRRILKYHFPNAEQYADIRTTDFTIWRGRVDVLTGGFPCQPFSLAGKRKGTEDDRYLWPEMLRVIRTVRPRWIVGENVFGIVNWSEGVVFEQVCSDLEAAGYAVQPYIIPACSVGAPHRRDRCWFVAYLIENPVCVRRDNDNPKEEPRTGQFGMSCAGGHVRVCGTKGIAAYRADAGVETMRERQDGVHAVEFVADTECLRGMEVHDKLQSGQPKWPRINSVGDERNASDASRYEDNRRRSRGFFTKSTGTNAQGNAPDADGGRLSIAGATWRRRSGFKDGRIIPNWDDFPTQSPVCCRNDGISGGLDGITFPKWRNMSIKAYGNAIVPQVALQIFKTINEYENQARKH